MPIDRNQPPTNKVLLECGPYCVTGKAGRIEIAIAEDSRFGRFGIELGMLKMGRRAIEIFSVKENTAAWLPLGHVSTLGEVIDLYETLSQKKWPGCD